jgi:hypothetical protein
MTKKRRQSHIFTHQNGFGVGRTLRPNRVRRLQFHVLSAPWRLCARIWVWGGDGAFAPESWVPSARRPYLFFSIRADSRDSRVGLKRQRTAVATTLLLRGFAPSCEVWSGPTSAKLTAGAFFQSGVGDAKKFHQFSDFCSSTRSMTSLRRRKDGVQGGSK